MADESLGIGTYDSHEKAETAVKQLGKGGFDMRRLSIVGKDYHTEEHVVGCYNTGDRMKQGASSARSGVACGASSSARRCS